MLFNSPEFLVFLPTVVLLYLCLPHRGQNAMLLVASYFFYGWWDWRFLGLIALSTVIDFTCGMGIHATESPRRRRLLLICSLCGNLGILGFFKYFHFFADSAATLLGAMGFQVNPGTLEIVLPVGISFYTFQTMTYTIDIYRRRLTPTRDLLSFALFVAYFPQLVAGPIERASSLLPRIAHPRRITAEHVHTGLWLMLIGFFKKVAIADAVAPHVEAAFAQHETGGWMTLLGGVYLFSLQIYCDFSGYSDIARGASRLMGIDLMVNFRRPYFSTSVRELWHRWHISLSTFLRDYLYIPLGGSRRGTAHTNFNLTATMLLGGLWHGASWIFVVWGALHGLYLSVHRLLTGRRRAEAEESTDRSALARTVIAVAKAVIVFHLVTLTWIYFRSETFAQAWDITVGIGAGLIHPVMAGDSAVHLLRALLFGLLIIPFDLAQELARTEEPWPTRAPVILSALIAAAMIVSLFAFGGRGEAFIYFQF